MRTVQGLMVGLALVVAGFAGAADPSADEPRVLGAQTFWRMVPGPSNDTLPGIAKTQAAVGSMGGWRSAGTGMAHNFTEFPCERGAALLGYRDRYAYYPRFAAVEITQRRVNVLDIVMDFPYVADGVVWGPAFREIAQTYTASQTELAGMSLLVASSDGEFIATVHEGGPDGKQLGAPRTFTSGGSGSYGWVRWMAGEVPTTPGEIYCIKMRRADGETWSPYLHATGDVYAGGMAWFDGRPEPETDVALFIVEQPPDMVRALQLTPHEEGWTTGTQRVHVKSRARNIRYIQVDAIGPTAFCNRFVCRIWSAADPTQLIHGPMIFDHACGGPGDEYLAAFVYGPKDVPLEIGEELIIDIKYYPGGDHDTPVSGQEGVVEKMRVTVYGDPDVDPLPVPSNQRVSFPTPDTMEIAWDRSYPSPVEVQFWRRDGGERVVRMVEPADSSVVMTGLEPGGVYWFTITALGAHGKPWKSPVYQAQMPGGDAPKAEPRSHLHHPPHPEAFLALAPLPLSVDSLYQPSGAGEIVPLRNAGFEEALEGWQFAGPTGIEATGTDYRIEPPEGRQMAGYHHRAGDEREQVFAEDELYQVVEVEPGVEYELSLLAYTDVFGAPRGDVRVRLLTDAAGKGVFTGHGGSQWYWTEGKWMRFTRRFVAASDQAAVGFAVFRWRDTDRAIAFVDDVQLRRLGKPEGR